MAEKRKHIDELYKENLGSYDEAPREAVWDRIEQNLNKLDSVAEGSTGTEGSRRKRRGFWFILSALLLLSSGAYVASQFNKKDNKQIAEQRSVQTPAENNSESANNTIADNSTANNTTTPTTPATVQQPEDKHDVNTQEQHTNGVKETNNNNKENDGANKVVVTDSNNTTQNTDSRNKEVVTSLANNNAQPIATKQVTPTVINSTKRLPEIKQGSEHNKEVVSSVTNTTTPSITTKQIIPTSISTTKQLPEIKQGSENNKEVAKKVTPIKHVNKQQLHTPVAKIDESTVAVNKNDIVIKNTEEKRVPEGIVNGVAVNNQVPTFTTEGNSNEVQHVNTLQLPVIDKGTTDKEKEVVIASAPTNNNNTNEGANTTNKTVRKNSKKKKSETVATTTPVVVQAPTPTPQATNEPIVTNTASSKHNKKNKKEKTIINTPEVVANAANNVNTTDNVTPNDKTENKTTINTATMASGPTAAEKLLKKMNLPFDLSAKVGVEKGTGIYTGNKGILSISGELTLSKKMSLLFEPGLVLTVLNRTIDYGTNPYISNQHNYYDSTIQVILNPDTFSNYTIYNRYDSLLIVRKSTRPTNVGLEIPVMLKYQLSKSFSLIGGVNISISKLFTISETVPATYVNLVDSTPIGLQKAKDFAPIFRNYNPQHTSEAYAPLQQADGNPIRLGYILGLGYQLNEKMNLELMMTQTITDQSYIHDVNIQRLYTQPYFRLSIGYKFYKHLPANTKK